MLSLVAERAELWFVECTRAMEFVLLSNFLLQANRNIYAPLAKSTHT